MSNLRVLPTQEALAAADVRARAEELELLDERLTAAMVRREELLEDVTRRMVAGRSLSAAIALLQHANDRVESTRRLIEVTRAEL